MTLTSITNAKTLVMHETDTRVTYTNVPFYSQGNAFNEITGKCIGAGDAMNLFGSINCAYLHGLTQGDPEACNGIFNCTLVNRSSIFGSNETYCFGYVNKSYYNITGTAATYCNNDWLQDYGICDTFGCSWVEINQTNSGGADDLGSTASVSTFWEQVKWVATFKADVGLGSFNWIFSILFFYIEFIMLLWAIYMALPFLH